MTRNLHHVPGQLINVPSFTPPCHHFNPTSFVSPLHLISECPFFLKAAHFLTLTGIQPFMMSQTALDKPHLFEDDLPESADRERKIFAEWASSVTFTKQAEDFEIHNSVELDIKLAPFLQSLNLSSKVYSFSFVQNIHLTKNRGIHWYRYRDRNMHRFTTAKAMLLSFQSKYLTVVRAPQGSLFEKESACL